MNAGDPPASVSMWWTAGAVVLALAVALGAFGAHALRDRLDADGTRRWQTASSYHFFHGFALFLPAIAQGLRLGSPNLLELSAWLFTAGLVLFSGSLYVMAVSGLRWLGAVTPLGGLAWIAAWVAFALGARG
jgi:uncharacterized membrane protein YgdD (TMEM256/DUF423 family)